MSSISTASLLHGRPDISQQLIGDSPINPLAIKDFDSFELIYKIRHDLIHSIVCDCRGLQFGEKRVCDVLSEHKIDLSKSKYFEDIKNQTPDSMVIKGRNVDIIEISVSGDVRMEQRKISKYALLHYFLRSNNLQVKLEVIVINPYKPYLNRHELINEHKLNDVALDLICDICVFVFFFFVEFRSTEVGNLYYLQHLNLISDLTEIDFEIADVLEEFDHCESKPFHSREDLLDVLIKPEKSYIDSYDEKFLQVCLDEAENMDSTLMTSEPFDPEIFINDINKMATSNEPRSVFPIPYIQLKSTDSSIRSTAEDADLAFKFAARMQGCNEPILAKVGKDFTNHMQQLYNSDIEITNENFLFPVKLSYELKEVMALEGPNRKKYIKKGSIKHIERQEEHANYSLHYSADVNKLELLSFQFSE
jgi:hypothetical protein